ncbi:MAG TPA: DUF3667 domain-containing protein [Pyrinomonadaceae bacterium]|nr:DUF3667 domain-containing protein [Pyrinomonadaceae bacterium]
MVETEAPEHCPNCGAELSGKYCAACGQKRIDRRDLSVRRFFGHVINELTDLQSNKILRTFGALLFKPGLLTEEYLAGKKGFHIGPVRLYLTFSALYFLFAWGALSDVRGGGAQRTARSRVVVEMARQRGIEPQIFADRIHQRAEKIAAVLRFASVLVSGGFLALLYFSFRKYYVEHLIFSFHYYSFDFFCKSVFALLFIATAAFGKRMPPMVLNFFYPVAFLYLVFALRRVYRQTWPWTVLKALILFACETALFIAVNIAGFFAAFGLA